MIPTKEGFGPAPEKDRDGRVGDFHREMAATGREALADILVAGLEEPKQPTLIIRTAGSGVRDGVGRLAEAVLDEPEKQLAIVDCSSGTKEEDLLGFVDPKTGERMPGAISDETKICLLDNFNHLPPTSQANLFQAAAGHETALYLTAGSMSPTGSDWEIIAPVMGRVQTHQVAFPRQAA